MAHFQWYCGQQCGSNLFRCLPISDCTMWSVYYRNNRTRNKIYRRPKWNIVYICFWCTSLYSSFLFKFLFFIYHLSVKTSLSIPDALLIPNNIVNAIWMQIQSTKLARWWTRPCIQIFKHVLYQFQKRWKASMDMGANRTSILLWEPARKATSLNFIWKQWRQFLTSETKKTRERWNNLAVNGN